MDKMYSKCEKLLFRNDKSIKVILKLTKYFFVIMKAM